MNKVVPASKSEVGSYILCAFNLEEKADEVVDSAVTLGALLKLPVMLLCSYRLIQSKGTEDVQLTRKRFETRAAEKLKQITKARPGVRHSLRAEIGFLSDRIEAFLKTDKARFLVISNEAASNIYEQKGLTLTEFIDKIKVQAVVVPQ